MSQKSKQFTNHNNILNNYNNIGVYRTNCNCDKFYIGKTNRNFLC